MRKGLTEVVFILDRSGSMSGLEADTIGGFNSMIEKQKNTSGEAYISVILFDDRCEVLYDRVDIHKVEPMNDRQYYVRGCTALLDAIGGAIHHIKNVHKYAREEDKPEKTLFIITTDGMENSSRQYSYDQVRNMIDQEKEKDHWEFLFFGANIDAIRTAGRFGIDSSRAVDFENDAQGTRLNYAVMSDIVEKAMAAKCPDEFSTYLEKEAPMDCIRKDYKKRHGKGDKIAFRDNE
ncbi:MAG: VWA domain-containing protein [Eubacterium sp.]|nr:VWA domain-containing protein [Eubacterium sp.]